MEQQATKVKKKKPKSRSQRIRAMLFLHWELNQPTKIFDDFYDQEMEKLEGFVKNRYL